MNLDELRTALTDLDGQLVDLVARRQALSEQVARSNAPPGARLVISDASAR